MADTVWRNPGTGDVKVAITVPNETCPSCSFNPIYVVTINDLNWHIVGVGNVSGSYRDDVIWVNRATDKSSCGI